MQIKNISAHAYAKNDFFFVAFPHATLKYVHEIASDTDRRQLEVNDQGVGHTGWLPL